MYIRKGFLREAFDLDCFFVFLHLCIDGSLPQACLKLVEYNGGCLNIYVHLSTLLTIGEHWWILMHNEHFCEYR